MDGQRRGAHEEVLDASDALEAERLVDPVREVGIVKNDVPAETKKEGCEFFYRGKKERRKKINQPNAFARSAAAVPILPSPKTPNVAPRIRATRGDSITPHFGFGP